MFPGESLPEVKSPLDKNDHPELDNSELASDDLITKFMCMIGQLQWAVTLGRYDISFYGCHRYGRGIGDDKRKIIGIRIQDPFCPSH